MRFVVVAMVVGGCSSSDFDVASPTDASVDDAVVGDTTVTDAPMGDSSITSDTGSGADASTVDAIDAVACGSTFPPFLRGCSIDPDCTFGLHLADCCGNEIAIGFAASEKAKFEVAEAAHRTACPANCKCAVGPVRTESGMSTDDKTRIRAACVSGTTCKSYVL